MTDQPAAASDALTADPDTTDPEEWLRSHDEEYQPTPPDFDPSAAGWATDADGHGRPLVAPSSPSEAAQARERKQRQRNRERFEGLERHHGLWVDPSRTRCQDEIHRPRCPHVENARLEDELRQEAAEAYRRHYGVEPSSLQLTWMIERDKSLLRADAAGDATAVAIATVEAQSKERVAKIRTAAGYGPEPDEEDDDWGLDLWKDSLR